MTGDYRQIEAELDEIAVVNTHEVIPVTDAECYCFVEGDWTPATRALYEAFTEGSLMVVPPIRCHEDGSAAFTIIGRETDIQTAITTVPEGIDIDIEAIGRQRVADDSIVGRLSDRHAKRSRQPSNSAIMTSRVTRRAKTSLVNWSVRPPLQRNISGKRNQR